MHHCIGRSWFLFAQRLLRSLVVAEVDSISEHTTGVLQGIEAMTTQALTSQHESHSGPYRPALACAIDELLTKSIAAYQRCVSATSRDQTVPERSKNAGCMRPTAARQMPFKSTAGGLQPFPHLPMHHLGRYIRPWNIISPIPDRSVRGQNKKILTCIRVRPSATAQLLPPRGTQSDSFLPSPERYLHAQSFPGSSLGQQSDR